MHYKACKWVKTLNPNVLDEVERLLGPMPSIEKNWASLPDGPAWTWWLIPILPLRQELQVSLYFSTLYCVLLTFYFCLDWIFAINQFGETSSSHRQNGGTHESENESGEKGHLKLFKIRRYKRYLQYNARLAFICDLFLRPNVIFLLRYI